MKKSALALLCAICFCTPVFSQTNQPVTSFDGVLTRLQALSADKAIEKVYLHFDKPYYNAGDTVYFKGYVTLGEQRELSKLSGLLHVDLINPDNTVVKRLSLQLSNGLASGDFELADNLTTADYHIRAYTRWMLNNGQTNFFDQLLHVNGKEVTNAIVQQSASLKPVTAFYAEGGNFVNNIPAKLAFKAIGANGLGVDVKGIVTDNTGAEVTKFESKHLGMGLVFITPEAGKNYKANLTYSDGTKAIVDLPQADNEGLALSVNNNDPDKLGIEINANKGYYLKNKNKEIQIVIYSVGSIRTVKAILDNQVLDLNLNKKDFKTGIVQITLFTAQGEPLNERLSFIQNADLLNITALSDKTSYAARGKVHININTKNKDGMPVKTYLSASVIDMGKTPVNEIAENTILSNLLLTSDLKGTVEQPNYYFTNVNNDTRADLDILMLTQGYRRFEWKQLLTDNAINIYKAESGFSISGQVKMPDGKPVDGGTVTIMPQAGGPILTGVTDNNGKFTFTDLAYEDKTQFILQAATQTGSSKVSIIINDDKNPVDVPNYDLTSSMSANAKKADDNKNIKTQPVYMASATGKLLEEVTIYDKKPINNDHSTQVLGKENLNDQVNLNIGLQGRLNGVVLRNGVPFLADRVSDQLTGGPMLIIVDDVTMQQGTSVNDLNIADIESVNVLKNNDAALFGVRGANGIMVIKTRKTKSIAVNKTLKPGLLYYSANGFYKARTFYAPVYDGSKTRDNKVDNRGTVYWNPNVFTDNNGNVAFDFFNADAKGTYRLVLEGTDGSGTFGRSVLTYKVE